MLDSLLMTFVLLHSKFSYFIEKSAKNLENFNFDKGILVEHLARG